MTVSLVFGLFLAASSPAAPLSVDALAPGQVWTVKADKALAMRVEIGRIETVAGHKVVSVSILHVRCQPPMDCETTDIDHAPFDAEALVAGLGRLEAEGAPMTAGFEGGYATWKADPRAGVWTAPPLKVASTIIDSLSAEADR